MFRCKPLNGQTFFRSVLELCKSEKPTKDESADQERVESNDDQTEEVRKMLSVLSCWPVVEVIS